MTHNVKSELRRSMDAIHFSGDDKERMVALLMSAEAPRQRRSGKKLLLLALAATLVVGALTGAAVFTRWSRSAQTAYNPPQQVKEQAEKSGLSVMLEDKQKEVAPGEVLSATDQGITITAVQSIVDSYGADLFFRVEGFTLPEGCAPEMFWDRDKVTIDGSTEFYSSMTGWFYDGTTRNEAGEWVYASNGQPVEFGNDKYQSAIYQWVADDGSLEYQMNIRFRDSGERYWGKEFSIHFNGIGVGAEKGGIMEEPLVSGSWDLHWTLTGADSTKNSVTLTPNMEIGDSGPDPIGSGSRSENHPCGLSVGSRLGWLEAAGDAFPRPLSNLHERRQCGSGCSHSGELCKMGNRTHLRSYIRNLRRNSGCLCAGFSGLRQGF